MSALEYNKSQNYDAETIERIQRTVGAGADGLWGKRTVTGVRNWQKTHGLPADGKCGPGTLEEFRKQWAADGQPCEDEELDDRSRDEAPHADADAENADDAVEAEAALLGEGFAYFDREVDIDKRSKGDDVIALYNDLFAFGLTNNPPRKTCGKKGVGLIAAFQRAASTPHRIAGFERVEVPVTYKPGEEGVVDAATRAEIRLWKDKGYRWQEPGKDFIERRVKVDKLGGTLARSSVLLVDVPGTNNKPRKLHRLAAAALAELTKACKEETGVELLVQSGWRRHRWKSRAHYEQVVEEKYGSLAEGRKYLAYSSPHETGLAVDFGTGGLFPERKTNDEQKKTPIYKWLVANAYRFGFCPYKVEAWHWEFPLSVRAWTTGESDWRLADEDE